MQDRRESVHGACDENIHVFDAPASPLLDANRFAAVVSALPLPACQLIEAADVSWPPLAEGNLSDRELCA